MKKLLLFMIIGILLAGFIAATPTMTGSAAKGNISSQNEGEDSNAASGTQNQEEIEQETQNQGEDSELRIRIKEQNKLKIGSGECPLDCTCTGSTTKCQMQNGREMTITAGNSGNTIVQVKGESMSTNVQLYKSEGKLYGVFEGNKTKEIKMMPDQLRERIREQLMLRNCSCEIELDEDGNYQVQTEKRARFLGFIPVNEKVKVYVDPETGETIRIRKSWWGFLARDVEEELLVGASCGTVTPGQNNACCQNKDYDYWDSEEGECLFNESE
ncbi:MAG: hypothetical protein KKF67_01775 [Nanoarchaeota archaeon]|nr:hypothetical protein [Nanoarchaeota archaeon]